MVRSIIETELGLDELQVCSNRLSSDLSYCNVDPATRLFFKIRDPDKLDGANAILIPTLIIDVPVGSPTSDAWIRCTQVLQGEAR